MLEKQIGAYDDIVEPKDRLTEMFELQTKFMELLRQHDKLPEYPVDLTTKAGQRLVKEFIGFIDDELHEAGATLKNKQHRLTDVTEFDAKHYLEELGDAWAYFMEILIISGLTASDLHRQFIIKNAQVTDRLRDGY